MIEALRKAIEVAFTTTEQRQEAGWHAGITYPFWDYDEFTAAVNKELEAQGYRIVSV